ncbi:MAG: outer membrane protein assembly factor BamA [Candidatus Aminicenantes bacterium]|nr:outer membrane protein assembly factor BamA [Candidatus Aminicenantes bacterium]
MKRLVLSLSLLILTSFLFSQELIERIDIIGNDRVTRETILYYLSSREGGYYNEETLRKDFRVLWGTGFFSNLRIEADEGERGKVVRIFVEENPVIRQITYKTGKKVKQDDITNKLKEKDAYLLPYSYYNPYKIKKIQQTILDLLAEKGLQAAKIEVETERKGKNEIELFFKIDEGPKLRVAEVVFTGQPKLPPSLLQEAMKSNQKHGFFTWAAGRDVYKENKLSEEAENIRKRLQEYGYMEASVGEPKIEETEKRTVFLKKQKMMRVVFPVQAGYRYVVGDIKIEGSKVIRLSYLESLVKLKSGEPYNSKLREKTIEKMGEVYRDGGFLYAQIIPVESLDPKNKVVNITFSIHEGELAFLKRLEFRGNTFTKDKVLRREMLIREGDPFRLALFKDSLLRIKQLGLVDLEKDPEVKPDPENPTQINATINVRELQRNNIQFTAGYSGYEGTFVALSYSTVNFLGTGETLEVTAQYGKRIKNYVFGFTEPYIRDLPFTAGFNIYDRYILIPYLYDQKARGVDLLLGGRIIGYLRANLNYSYQFIDIKPPAEEGSYYYFDPYYIGLYGWGRYKVSSLTPTIYRSTVDSPLTPTRGTMYLVSVKFAGSFLGGEVHLIKPHFEWTFFRPVFFNHVIGLHLDYEYVKPLRKSQVPFWEKFYLGGERSLRGYEIYSIGPRSEKGTNIGGDKSFIFNAEYIIPVGGPLYFILFYDRGNAYALNEKISWKNTYTSTGLEVRIFVPALRVPFRLIFAYNNPTVYKEESRFAFRFAIGTTF